MQPQDILQFWFSPKMESYWFAKSDAVDNEIRHRFYTVYDAAAQGQLHAWEENAESMLALLILLDQFPRNMFRNDARSFATDEQALRVSKQMIERGMDQQLSPVQRRFVYLPFMHSEALADQVECVRLFEMLGDPLSIDYARRHHSIIARFGRFPHRNTALSRITTPLEEAFLQTPGSSF